MNIWWKGRKRNQNTEKNRSKKNITAAKIKTTKVMPSNSIAVIGSLNIDFITRTPRVPGPGETLTSNSFSTGFGGKGANQAVACAKLSRTRALQDANVTVMMAGAVGEDSHGTVLLDSLTSYGVDVTEVARNAADSEFSTSGTAVVMVDQQTGQNRIILSPGANASVQSSRFADIFNPKPALLVMQLEIPFETVLEACRTAKAAGIPVLLNPAPAAALPDEVYDGLVHLILNETEIALLAGVSEAELEDHLATVLVELGRELVSLDEGGGEPALLRDGSDIQRLVAERHGEQRARLGWGADELAREYRVVREEVDRLLAGAPPDMGGQAYVFKYLD